MVKVRVPHSSWPTFETDQWTAPPLNVPPSGELTNVAPAGSGSVSVAPSATPCPSLYHCTVTVTVAVVVVAGAVVVSVIAGSPALVMQGASKSEFRKIR